MTSFKPSIAAAALALALAGCGPGETANDVVTNTDAPAESEMNSMMHDSGNPFAGSEMAMQQGMTSAVGTDVSDSWTKLMIEHHKGAITMSEAVLKHSPPPAVRKMAEDVPNSARRSTN